MIFWSSRSPTHAAGCDFKLVLQFESVLEFEDKIHRLCAIIACSIARGIARSVPGILGFMAHVIQEIPLDVALALYSVTWCPSALFWRCTCVPNLCPSALLWPCTVLPGVIVQCCLVSHRQ